MNIFENLEKTENFYKNKKTRFSNIGSYFLKNYDIPVEITEYQIKKDFTGSKNEYKVLTNKILLIEFLKFIIIYLSVLLSYIFHKSSTKVKKFDIVFDEWKSAPDVINLYYQPIINKYKAKKNYILSQKLTSRNLYDLRCINKQLKSRFLKSSFIYVLKLIKLSYTDNMNYLKIFRNLSSKIFEYEKDCIGVESKIFITGGDGYYGAYKYFIYKRKLNTMVFMIQHFISNGGQTNDDNYRIADTYFVFSEYQRYLMKNCKAKNIFCIGSIRLHNQLKAVEKINTLSYDIAIVEEYPDDIDSLCYADSYLKFVENLSIFSHKNKSKKIVFMYRPNREAFFKRDAISHKRMTTLDNILNKSNFIFEKNKNSYELINGSEIVCAYTSTLGIESLAMNKKVLFCNPEGVQNRPFKSDNLEVVASLDYNVFEEKIQFLLKMNLLEKNDYFINLRNKYVHNTKEPYDKIFEKIDNQFRDIDEKS